jgi:peptide/nickel transport system ATP-binding protein
MIAIEGLELAFGSGTRRHQVLHDVSFDVGEGEAFGLVGESGSGKTTVLRCLAGLYQHWQGEIRIGGRNLGHKIDRERVRRIQMVFQDPYGSLHPRHTVNAALAEPLQIHGIGDVDGRVTRILAKVGLDASFRWRYPHQMSGGQRQRVAIARALIGEPAIVMADEPTGNLDSQAGANVLATFDELNRAGHTLILVTHDPGVASRAQRIVHISDGKVV